MKRNRRKEPEQPVWEEQYPSPEERSARSSADIILCDILWDALRQL
jgi:hypothetical protein